MRCYVTTLKFRFRMLVIRSMTQKMPKKPIIIERHIPDIAIVDLGSPDEDGLSLIRRWRSNDVSLPILVLTARESWQDKVEVLSAGRHDYVTKPFHIEEVMARMQALMRRNSGLASQVISLPPVSG